MKLENGNIIVIKVPRVVIRTIMREVNSVLSEGLWPEVCTLAEGIIVRNTRGAFNV